ncbi:MAG: Gldg family protein [Eubacteriales bacterium]|nr:Gldg family protein [Eubacteriales bacterium]
MTAVYKKEVKGFLTSMTGYVFIAFLLALTGIYFTAYHLQAMYPKFAYTLQAVLFIFLILVPVLTMRILAEERRQKTDQLLLTSPVSVTGIVAGKFLALVSVFAIPVLILAVYPLILSQFGSIAYLESYSALFGFFLLGVSYLAIGLFLSSVTESQVIAAVLTFFTLFVSYMMEGISSLFPDTASGSFFTMAALAAALAFVIHHMLGKTVITAAAAAVMEGILAAVYIIKPAVYEGLIQNILEIFNVTAHFEEFAGGMFDIAGVIYYLSVTALFLFLTVESIQKRRWGAGVGRLKNGSYSMAMTAIVIAASVAVNLIASELPSGYMQIDVTDQKLSVLTDQTKEMAAKLTEDVTLYYIVQDSNRDTNVSRLLERYNDLSSHIKVEEKDPVRYPNFTSQYTSEGLTENSVIVTCGELSRVVDYNDMYEYEMDYTYYSYTTSGFDAEGQITSAIAAVSSDNLPKIYTLTGHGEQTLDTNMTSAIEKENITTEELNLISAERVPEDADGLLILSPASDLTQAESNKIRAYLMTGGSAVIILDYTNVEMPNLESILEYYGMNTAEGVVMEGDPQNYVQIPYYLVPVINNTEVSADMADGNGYVIMAGARGLTVSDDIREETAVSEVLSTSSSAYSKTDVENMTAYEKESGDIDGPFALGMLASEEIELTEEVKQEAEALLEENDVSARGLAQTLELAEEETEAESEIQEKETETEPETAEELAADETENESTDTVTTKLAVYTSSAIVDSSMSQMVSGGNQKLFTNTLSWMCGQETSVSVPVKSMSTEYLTLTAASSNFWSVIVVGIIPGAFLLYGFCIWLRRRKQ